MNNILLLEIFLRIQGIEGTEALDSNLFLNFETSVSEREIEGISEYNTIFQKENIKNHGKTVDEIFWGVI